MSLHIRKALRKAGKAWPYVSMAAGFFVTVGFPLYHSADRTSGPVHDRRRELATKIGKDCSLGQLIENSKQTPEELNSVTRKYIEIMKRPDVKEDLAGQEARRKEGVLPMLMGILIGGAAFYFGSREIMRESKEEYEARMKSMAESS